MSESFRVGNAGKTVGEGEQTGGAGPVEHGDCSGQSRQLSGVGLLLELGEGIA